MSVLLPAPFSPRRAWISPTRRSKSTPSLATTPGKRLTIPRISTASGGAATLAGAVIASVLEGKSPRRPGRRGLSSSIDQLAGSSPLIPSTNQFIQYVHGFVGAPGGD